MLDGGIADSIPVQYAREQDYDKLLAKLFYRKYPNLQKALDQRNTIYNTTMDLIEKLEDEGKIIVIRPIKPVEVGRMEKDTAKLTALYHEGYELAAALL